MPRHDIVVIGGSAGAVDALTQLVKKLPADLPIKILIVVHFPSFSKSVLPQILQRAGSLPVVHADHLAPLQPGKIYVAPPDHHLSLKRGYLQLDQGPRENGYRPAIDVLFRSAAQAYGQRVMGIVLSGMLDDGTAGLSVIKAYGGMAIVQDPGEALFESMPRNAIERVKVDDVLTLSAIAALLIEDSQELTEDGEVVQDETTPEAKIVADNKASLERGEAPGSPSPLTCPDCGGVLWELNNSNMIRFRCHVGHAYSIDSLLSEQANDVEKALWSAVRALEEKAALARRMANRARVDHRLKSELQFLNRAQDAEENARLLREIIARQNSFADSSKKVQVEEGNGSGSA